MTRRGGFRLLVATDGSAQGQAAVSAAAAFPWPRGARAHAVLARGRLGVAEWPAEVRPALERGFKLTARRVRRILGRRWPDPQVTVTDRPPVEGILSEARRLGARVIVVGSRGLSALARLVVGSVSRAVVRRSTRSVLIVRGRPREFRRVVVGLDGSANSRRAVAFVRALKPLTRGRVTLVRVLEPPRMPALGLLPPSVRAVISGQAAALHAEQVRKARRDLEAAAALLRRSGWVVRTSLPVGVPLDELLGAGRAARATLLVVGARGVGGVTRLLLGSIAEGALNRSAVSVLVVR